MNNKGLLNFPLGFIGFFVLMLVLVSLLPAQISGDTYNVTQTINTLNNSQSKFVPNESQHPVIKVAYSFIGFVIYSAFEITELAVSWGSENIDIVNPKMLLYLVMFCLIAPLIVPLFKILIIILILTKEYFQNKKEKKELNELKKTKR